jgi:hypothetical protein
MRSATSPIPTAGPIKGGVVQGYYAQISVDGAHQIIIAQRVQTSPVHACGLKPLLSAARPPFAAIPKSSPPTPGSAPIPVSPVWPAVASRPLWPRAERGTATSER